MIGAASAVLDDFGGGSMVAPPTPTDPPVPPTATNTPTITPVPPAGTNTPTNTPVPATATSTPTRTPVPPTATNTPTNTPAPPTATSTPSGSLGDTTAADFSLGAPGSNTYIAQTTDGELQLAPTVGAEFSGLLLPSGWSATPWAAGGSAAVGGGKLTVDGALASTDAYYGQGHSLEFVATFGANTSQHVGFGTDLNAAPWAIFSTGYPGGTTLQARTDSGNGSIDTNLGDYLGAPHRYRIDWTATGVTYYIDGVQVASHSIAIRASMRPVASDLAGGPTLLLDWLRMSPYAASGSFTSRLFDAGAAHWLTLNWTGGTPAGTTVGFDTGPATHPTRTMAPGRAGRP